jgi:hypothetical protein
MAVVMRSPIPLKRSMSSPKPIGRSVVNCLSSANSAPVVWLLDDLGHRIVSIAVRNDHAVQLRRQASS